MDIGHIGAASGNLLTSVGLAVAGILAFAMAMRRRDGARRLFAPAVSVAIGCGLVTLAADEGLEVHDRIGRWLWHEHGIAAPGPINHVDDLFVLAYIAAGAVTVGIFLSALRHRPLLLGMLVLAGALFATGSLVDALARRTAFTMFVEEATETAGAVLLAAAFTREYYSSASWNFHIRIPLFRHQTGTIRDGVRAP
jgi:multisubunit Na+/H+ antiporter MnhB subunit